MYTNYYHALTLKKYARNLYSCDFWHTFSCPPTLFHSFTLCFPSKARDGMGNSAPSWHTFWWFLGILAYKRGWLQKGGCDASKRGPMPPPLREKVVPAKFTTLKCTNQVFLRYGSISINTKKIPISTNQKYTIPNWYCRNTLNGPFAKWILQKLDPSGSMALHSFFDGKQIRMYSVHSVNCPPCSKWAFPRTGPPICHDGIQLYIYGA